MKPEAHPVFDFKLSGGALKLVEDKARSLPCVSIPPG